MKVDLRKFRLLERKIAPTATVVAATLSGVVDTTSKYDMRNQTMGPATTVIAKIKDATVTEIDGLEVDMKTARCGKCKHIFV